MKKRIVTLLKQPWFYILIVELFLCFLFPLADNPGWLYRFLPESGYDAWEEFAVIHMEGYLAISTLFLILLSGSLAFGSLISVFCAKDDKKIILLMSYVILTFIACGIFLPTLGRAREKAKRISCATNLKQIYLALQQYALDSKSHLPPNLKLLYEKDYLTYEKVYHCPSRNRPNTEFSDYLYLGDGRRLDENPSFLLLRDHDRNHPGKYYNLLMSDGHIIYHDGTIESAILSD